MNDVVQTARLDTLPWGGLSLWQGRETFNYTSDSVLLASFAYLAQGASVLELGAGTGAISLLLSARGARCVTGVELSPALAALFAASIEYNGLEERIRAIQADIRNLAPYIPAGTLDLVVANPPYRRTDSGRLRKVSIQQAACHEQETTLDEFVRAASFAVKYRGRVAFCYLPERLVDLCLAFRQAGLEPKRLQLVYARDGQPAQLALVEAVRGGRPGLAVAPPLVLYEGAGRSYTKQALRWYGGDARSEKGGERDV